MPRRDYAVSKERTYKTLRKTARRDEINRENTKKKIRAVFFFIVFGGFISTAVYWLFFSPLFKFQTVSVRDIRTDDRHDELLSTLNTKLQETRFFIFSQNNFFVLRTNKIEKFLSQKRYNPSITDIHVEKIWPDTIEVVYKTRIPSIKVLTRRYESSVFQGPAEHSTTELSSSSSKDFRQERKRSEVLREYVIDDEGIVVQTQPHNNINYAFTILLDTEKKNVLQGDMLVVPERIQDIRELNNLFKKQGTLVPERYAIQEGIIFDVQVKLKLGFEVYLSFEYALQTQINNLLLTLEKVQNKQDRLQYIDLRIEGRAYACCYLDV